MEARAPLVEDVLCLRSWAGSQSKAHPPSRWNYVWRWPFVGNGFRTVVAPLAVASVKLGIEVGLFDVEGLKECSCLWFRAWWYWHDKEPGTPTLAQRSCGRAAVSWIQNNALQNQNTRKKKEVGLNAISSQFTNPKKYISPPPPFFTLRRQKNYYIEGCLSYLFLSAVLS